MFCVSIYKYNLVRGAWTRQINGKTFSHSFSDIHRTNKTKIIFLLYKIWITLFMTLFSEIQFQHTLCCNKLYLLLLFARKSLQNFHEKRLESGRIIFKAKHILPLLSAAFNFFIATIRLPKMNFPSNLSLNYILEDTVEITKICILGHRKNSFNVFPTKFWFVISCVN